MAWAYRVDRPGFVQRVEVAEGHQPLEPGQIRLRFRAGGLCGSDMPALERRPIGGEERHDGAPIHEIVGEVLDSASESLAIGQRVVGTGGAAAGLAEFLVESDTAFIPVPDTMNDVEAVPIQSISTVIRAVDSFPQIEGRRIVVLGAGPIGLAFAHVLRHRGAEHITVVDPVPREDISRHYGADRFVSQHSSHWVTELQPRDRPDIVVEAVGHQHATVRDALRAVADWGFVYGFGAAADDEYSLPYREMYERGLTLSSGRTLDGWVDVLTAGRDYLLAHRDDFANYVSHALPVMEAQMAYSLYARPQESRLKVALFDGGSEG